MKFTIVIKYDIVYLFSGNRHLAAHIRTLDWVEWARVEVALCVRK